MLELIVLGEIPGTTAEITFQWVIIMATLVVGSFLLRSAHKHQITIATKQVEEITI